MQLKYIIPSLLALLTSFVSCSENDYNFPLGAYFSVKMSKGEDELSSTESFEIDKILHYVAREYDDNEKITKTTYYKLNIVLKDSESLADTVVPVDSITVTKLEAVTYYSEDSKSFIDILDSKIVFISIDGSKYLVSESTYDSNTKEYRIVLSSLKEYTVKIDDKGVMTLTEITEEIPEEAENPENNE